MLALGGFDIRHVEKEGIDIFGASMANLAGYPRL